jgi:hypothetical protein
MVVSNGVTRTRGKVGVEALAGAGEWRKKERAGFGLVATREERKRGGRLGMAHVAEGGGGRGEDRVWRERGWGAWPSGATGHRWCVHRGFLLYGEGGMWAGPVYSVDYVLFKCFSKWFELIRSKGDP